MRTFTICALALAGLVALVDDTQAAGRRRHRRSDCCESSCNTGCNTGCATSCGGGSCESACVGTACGTTSCAGAACAPAAAAPAPAATTQPGPATGAPETAAAPAAPIVRTAGYHDPNASQQVRVASNSGRSYSSAPASRGFFGRRR